MGVKEVLERVLATTPQGCMCFRLRRPWRRLETEKERTGRVICHGVRGGGTSAKEATIACGGVQSGYGVIAVLHPIDRTSQSCTPCLPRCHGECGPWPETQKRAFRIGLESGASICGHRRWPKFSAAGIAICQAKSFWPHKAPVLDIWQSDPQPVCPQKLILNEPTQQVPCIAIGPRQL